MISPPNALVTAGKIAREAIELGRELCKTATYGLQVDEEIEKFIRSKGGVPALKGYKPPFSTKQYEHTICLSINNEAVHGVPKKLLRPDLDIITIDLVVGFEGWFADSARTFTHSKEVDRRRLVDASWIIFQGALAAVVPNQPTSLYGITVEAAARHVGLVPVKEYCGHGIGQEVHMSPQILNYSHDQKTRFEAGRAYAVEPVLASKPNYKLRHDNPDGWTVDVDCLTTHNEDTLFITNHSVINLTGNQS